MKVLNEADKKLLDSLVTNELVIIEKGFSISEFTGKVFLKNAITDFIDIHLKAKYGEIIPSMCREYRYCLIGLLKNINAEYKSSALSEVLIPTIGKVPTDELLKALNDTAY